MEITAAVVRGPGKEDPFQIEKIELEDPRDHEVLVKIAGVGLCHTDLFVKEAMSSAGMLPWVLGHEGSGVVEKVGSAVTKVVPGDHVVMSFSYCGQCKNCKTAFPGYCKDFFPQNAAGTRMDGSFTMHKGNENVYAHFFGQSSFASHAIANERNIVKVDKNVPINSLGPLGCGIQTGAGAVINSLKARPGTSIAVFGAGAVGLSAILGAVVCGCTKIMAVDILPERLKLAQELGATHLINGKTANVVDEIKKITDSLGADYSVECTGNPNVICQAIESVGVLGTCGLVSLIAAGLDIKLDWTVITAGRNVRGIIEGDSMPDVFIPHMIELYKAGRFPFDKLITYRPLSEINKAVEDTHTGKAVKVILLP